MSADTEPWCPSSQPDLDGSLVLGVVGGTVDEPRVSLLADPIPVTPEVLRLAEPVEPTEVFRFAAPCVGSACQHFDGSRCRLVQKIVALEPPAVDDLPACRLRPRCRWWLEEGRDACFRCPLVVTNDLRPRPSIAVAADPGVPPGAATGAG